MSYRDSLKKKIVLPSGPTVEIRKINAFNLPFIEKRVKEDEGTHGVRLTRFILLNKIGLIDGLRVVESVTDESKEISPEEIDHADLQFIVQNVVEFSGLSVRAEEARKTFPEAEGSRGECPPAGQGLRSAADGNTEASA